MASEPVVTYHTKDIKFTLRSADNNVMPIDLNIAVAYGDEDLGYYNPDANLTYDGNSYNSKNDPPIEFSTTKRGSVEKIFIFDRIELNYILNFKEPKQNVIIKKVGGSTVNHKIYFNSSSSEETPIWTEIIENTTYPISFDSSFDVTDGFVLGNWRQFKVVYTDNNNDLFDFITSVEYIDDLGNNLTMFEINFKRTELEVAHVYLQDIDNLRTNLTSNLTLTQDLDFNDDASYNQTDLDWQAKKLLWTTGEGWIPIDNLEFDGYTGVFDGAGFTISNLYSHQPIKNVGGGEYSISSFINQSSGVIKNLNFNNVNIIGRNISESYCSIIMTNSGNIINCTASGNISDGGIGSFLNSPLGGIIENCKSSLNISSSIPFALLGSFCSRIDGNVTIRNCHSGGSIVCSGDESIIGGFIGINGISNTNDISNCYSVGLVQNTGLNSEVGGFIGRNEGSGSIISCYYDSQTSGQTDIGKGTPKTTSEMKLQSTYIGWDFNMIWKIEETVNYPEFKVEVVSDYISKWTMSDFNDVKGVNNLNNIGGLTFGVGVRGDASTAMVFSGSDSVLFLNNDIILKNNEPFTITGWVYVEDFTHQFQHILNLKTEKPYGLTIAVSSYPAYKGISVNNVEDCLSGQMNNIAFVEKTWTFIAVSSPSCSGSFDFEITTNEYTKKPTELAGGFPVVSNSNGFSIASSSDYGFKGKLQNFRYYKRVLTTAEKTEIYNYERLI